MVCVGGVIKVCSEGGGGTVPTYNNNNRVNNPPQNNTSAGNGTFNNGAVGGVNSDNSNGGVIVNRSKPTLVNQIVIPINIGIVVGVGQLGQVYLPTIPRNDIEARSLYIYIKRGIRVLNHLEKRINKWVHHLNKATEHGNSLKVVRGIYQNLIRKGISMTLPSLKRGVSQGRKNHPELLGEYLTPRGRVSPSTGSFILPDTFSHS
jgi:hypothetical protein